MKYPILIALTCLFAFRSNGQTHPSRGKFGFVLNSSLNGEVYPIRLVPSVSYYTGKNQFELGLGLHPILTKKDRILSCEMNYKFFPNGTANKFNMFLITRFSYVNLARDSYYPATYNYLFLNGGYGFEINAFKGAYVGTNISTGAFTYQKSSQNPYLHYSKERLFNEIGINVAFQFCLGYRFK
ncbi:MAG: hypothetical protein H6608_12500 [Flavobacteriales bacterium]|nr:hypothetical protein [Bacteroidota bacterium]MCB9241952.1 hypothetical protein [Flavobacteriales bacterium]